MEIKFASGVKLLPSYSSQIWYTSENKAMNHYDLLVISLSDLWQNCSNPWCSSLKYFFREDAQACLVKNVNSEQICIEIVLIIIILTFQGSNIPLTPRQVDKLVATLDRDGDGEIDYR